MHAGNDQIRQIRKQIDKIDTDIIQLLAKRFRAVQKIGRIKKKSNTKVTDNERELFLHGRLELLAGENHLDVNFLRRLWKEILKESYRIQRVSEADE